MKHCVDSRLVTQVESCEERTEGSRVEPRVETQVESGLGRTEGSRVEPRAETRVKSFVEPRAKLRLG